MSRKSALWNDLVTDVGTSLLYPLGTLREEDHPTFGTKTYRYVTNVDSIAFAAGNVIQRKTGVSSGGSGIVCVTTDVYKGCVLGVAISAIAAAGYGWVQITGYNAALVTDGSVTALDPLGSKGATTAGSVYTVTKGLGTDIAYAQITDSGTTVTAVLFID